MTEPAETPVPPGPAERRVRLALAAGLAIVGLAALGTGIGLIVASRTGGGGTTTVARTVLPGADQTNALLAGIPQNGLALGSPRAPVTLVEWADLQCPFCREWAMVAFPTLVHDYVRPGKLQIVFRGLAFLGPDSQRALQLAFAAGLHDRLWNVVDLLYRIQGIENTGWATDAVLRDVAASVPGLDLQQLLLEVNSSDIRSSIARAAQAGTASHVTGTPTFDIGKTGAKTFHRLNVANLTAPAFKPAIEKLLR